MPFVIHPRVRKVITRLAAVTAFGVFASTGVAAANCVQQPTSQPFSQWGDTKSYFLLPGGAFEGGYLPSGWSFWNASPTLGNEPFHVHSAYDTWDVTLAPGGSAISPSFCMDATMPSFRFFAHQTVPGSALKVTLQVSSGTQLVTTLTSTVSSLSDGSFPTWAPTGSLNLASLLNIGSSATLTGRLYFSVGTGFGQWQLDDVYVDPYRTA